MADSETKIHARWDESCDASSEQRSRMLDDLRFSNPTDPEQWDATVKNARRLDPSGARPTMTFDKTNERIAQVVNDARMNKPQIETIPANINANEQVADVLNGMIRQIEYASSASIAYDTAIEHAARVGLGWFRIVPRVMDPKLNYQEIRIERVHDCLSVKYDPGFTMPDGSDQKWGFIETMIAEDLYTERYLQGKKRDLASWFGDKGESGWYQGNQVRIVEYFEIVEEKKNRIVSINRDDDEVDESEDDYHASAQKDGSHRPIKRTYTKGKTRVKWSKLDGNGFLPEGEPTDFPSRWIPLIPVMGYELWIEGKRYLCGMVRRMRDGQVAYNMSRSAEIETAGKQPKTPYMVDWQSIQNPEHQRAWAEANQGNPLWLPYDSRDADGNQLPSPSRVQPPSLGNAFGMLSQQSLGDIDSSIGQYQANRGERSNESSGIAIRRREQQGDTANFHYIDNLTRSMTHAGRIIVDMLPKIYDEKRQARMLGMDGKSEVITVNPNMSQPVKTEGKKVVAISLKDAAYETRCKVGPAYASLREEAAAGMEQMIRAFPAFAPVLGPLWARMQDWPEHEKASKAMLSMAPPQVQALEEGDSEVSPQALAQIQQMKQALEQLQAQNQQLSQALENAAGHASQAENQNKDKDAENEIKRYSAITDRLKLVMPILQPVEAVGIAEETFQEAGVPIPPQMPQPQMDPAMAQGQPFEDGGPVEVELPPEPPLDPMMMAMTAMMEQMQLQGQAIQNLTTVMAAPKQAAKDPATGVWTMVPVVNG